MFIGHIAAGVAAKKWAPKRNLAWLLVAPLWLDFVFPPLVLLGVEKMHLEPGNTAVMPFMLDYLPWSHSLLMTLLWSILYGVVVLIATKDKRAAAICAALVSSHWVLDVITHRPDMPLVPGSETRLGLGLWHSVPATLAVELSLWAAAWFLYFRVTRPKTRAGTVAPIAFCVLLTLSYFANVFGPPPANERQFAWMILGSILLVPFVWWFDRLRSPSETAEEGRR